MLSITKLIDSRSSHFSIGTNQWWLVVNRHGKKRICTTIMIQTNAEILKRKAKCMKTVNNDWLKLEECWHWTEVKIREFVRFWFLGRKRRESWRGHLGYQHAPAKDYKEISDSRIEQPLKLSLDDSNTILPKPTPEAWDAISIWYIFGWNCLLSKG